MNTNARVSVLRWQVQDDGTSRQVAVAQNEPVNILPSSVFSEMDAAGFPVGGGKVYNLTNDCEVNIRKGDVIQDRTTEERYSVVSARVTKMNGKAIFRGTATKEAVE